MAARTENKTEALAWLASQLRWENTLGALRHARPTVEHDAPRRAA